MPGAATPSGSATTAWCSSPPRPGEPAGARRGRRGADLLRRPRDGGLGDPVLQAPRPRGRHTRPMETVAALSLGPNARFLVPLVLCRVVDWPAFMLLAVPIHGPIVDAQGYDPVRVWTLSTIDLTVGSVTSPFGCMLMAPKGASRARPSRAPAGTPSCPPAPTGATRPSSARSWTRPWRRTPTPPPMPPGVPGARRLPRRSVGGILGPPGPRPRHHPLPDPPESDRRRRARSARPPRHTRPPLRGGRGRGPLRPG